MEEKLNLPKPVLFGALAIIIALAGFFIFRSLVPGSDGPPPAPDKPEIVWLKQKSKEVKGDFSKLSADEQARANAATAGRGAMSVGIYGGTPAGSGH